MKYQVRFKDNELDKWFDLTEKLDSKEKTESVWDQQTYFGNLYTKEDEKLFFVIKVINEEIDLTNPNSNEYIFKDEKESK